MSCAFFFFNGMDGVVNLKEGRGEKAAGMLTDLVDD